MTNYINIADIQSQIKAAFPHLEMIIVSPSTVLYSIAGNAYADSVGATYKNVNGKFTLVCWRRQDGLVSTFPTFAAMIASA